MEAKKTELKVAITSGKDKIKTLKTVSKLTGVDEVTVNAEKGTVTIIGTVDPVEAALQLRKAGICAEITSVGPPKKPEPQKPKPNPEPDNKPKQPQPPCCRQCPELLAPVSYVTYDVAGGYGYGPYGVCNIL